MTSVAVFPAVRQPRFRAKRAAMLSVLARINGDEIKAEAVLDCACQIVDRALEADGIPAPSRRAAIAAFRDDMEKMANCGSTPERSTR